MKANGKYVDILVRNLPVQGSARFVLFCSASEPALYECGNNLLVRELVPTRREFWSGNGMRRPFLTAWPGLSRSQKRLCVTLVWGYC